VLKAIYPTIAMQAPAYKRRSFGGSCENDPGISIDIGIL